MAPKLPRSSEVWHGKTFVLPSPEGPEAAPLVLAIWANESDQVVVHASFTPLAKGPVRLVTSFDDATRSPMVGLPRVPRRIVVENRQAADQLSRLHGVQAFVRDVPLIDEIARAALSEVASRANVSPTSTGRVSSAAQLELQKAAALLWKAKPWEELFDSDWIVVEAPGDPLDGHVLSVLGARKEVFGFCKYTSLAEARDFFEKADPYGDRAQGTSHYILLSINDPSELHPVERRQPAPATLGKRRAVVMKQAGTPAVLPPTEAETLTMARVARALAAFDLDDGVGESDGLSLRFHFDDEDWDDEDSLGVETTSTAREGLPSVGRSVPDEAPASRWCALDRQLFPSLWTFARRRDLELGPGAPATGFDYDLIFHEVGSDGLTAAEAWLRLRTLDQAGTAWFESHRAARTSVHRVLAVTPGERLHLEDIFTGARRHVLDRSASQPGVIGMLVCCRIVETQGEWWLAATEPEPMPEVMATIVRAQVGELLRLPKVKPIAEERLSPLALSNLLAITWEMVRTMLKESPPQPVLQNTDGHPLVDVKEHYVAVERGRLVTWLDARPELRREDGDALVWEWWRDGFQGNPDMVTTLGRIKMDGRRVTAFTNSVERADILARLLAESGSVRLERRDATPFEMPTNPGPARPREAPPPEHMAAALAFKTQHYATWLDLPVPALGDKSPRKAIKTARGRAEVEALLREMERLESRNDAPARFDVNILRRELGLPVSEV